MAAMANERVSATAALALVLGSAILAMCAAPVRPPAVLKAPPLPVPELLLPDRAGEPRLWGAAGLTRFFAALRRTEEKQTAAPLRVVQIGDSHTAADAFSGRLREAFQNRYGGAGRGWLPAGVPFKYYNPRLVSVAEEGWRHQGPTNGAPPEALGLDALVAVNDGRRADMTLRSTDPAGFDRLAVEYLAQPEGGDLTVAVDHGPSVRVVTAAALSHVERKIVWQGRAGRAVELATEGGAPVAVIGWTVERGGPGVIYENHGVIGARASLLGRMDPAALGVELGDSRPALLVVAFGTNEGFDDAFDRRAYAAMFRDNVARLQLLAPQAAVLIVGPPDGNRSGKGCAAGERRSAACAPEAGVGDACAWHEPPYLAAVRETQKAVAGRAGWAFWDWSLAMGGACSMHRFFRRAPPWAFADHVHLNRDGYAATADVLFFDLVSAYERWRASAVGS
jgi:lysophospholipase L1-like esterase